MSRSRGQVRRFAKRAGKLRFPYQLFDFQFSNDGKDYVGEGGGAHGLVRINTQAIKVIPLRELPADQALWAMMMFDFISRHEHSEELSHAGSGTVTKTKKNQILVPGSAVVPYITREDMTKENFDIGNEEDGIRGRESTGQNDWLEERYSDQVPEEIFNLVGEDAYLMLTDGSAFEPSKMLTDDKRAEIECHNSAFLTGEDEKIVSIYEGVQTTSFGKPEEMDADRRWLARFNQAKHIQMLADEEFEARKEEIWAWYEERVRANADMFLEAAARGSLSGEILKSRGTFDKAAAEGDLVSQWYRKNDCPWYLPNDTGCVRLYDHRHGVSPVTGHRTWGKLHCHVSGQAASVWTLFKPYTANSLALLAGCAVSDLPDVLQHWLRSERYVGNSILDRLDPMDAHLKNPWISCCFYVVLGLSKQQFNHMLKIRGLPKRTPEQHEGSTTYY